MYILIARGVRGLRNGQRSAKEYPHWDELVRLLKPDYEVREVRELPLDELEKLVKGSLTVICCDSFMQHFCWYVGKQAIVLWGKSDPLIFGHPENINIIRDRRYLRPDPWRWWEDITYNPKAFVLPDIIVQEVKKLVQSK